MAGDSYYEFQGDARGLHTSSGVEVAAGVAARAYRRLLVDWLPEDRNAAIHEAGCGPGIMLRYLAGEGFSNLSASDISAREVVLARQTGANVAVAHSQVDLAQQPTESLDCIIAIDFIEHLARDEVIEFLAQSNRALSGGGSLILRMPNGDSPLVGRNLYNDITHVWAYTCVATWMPSWRWPGTGPSHSATSLSRPSRGRVGSRSP